MRQFFCRPPLTFRLTPHQNRSIGSMGTLKVLLLAGGHSSRMGSPKHLLSLADEPLYLHLIRILHEALSHIETLFISLADGSIVDDSIRKGIVHLAKAGPATTITMRLNIISDDTDQDIGPAAGLLAAYRTDPTATWLIVACDYPILCAAAVRQLVDDYEPPVTCFKNAEGFSEPLLAIWSPYALEQLRINVETGRSGPSFTVKKLNGKLIVPGDGRWLMNANTKEEWEKAKASWEEDHLRLKECG
jgi:molybdopterin-guanine dinucleotide biosynthesis protein A